MQLYFWVLMVKIATGSFYTRNSPVAIYTKISNALFVYLFVFVLFCVLFLFLEKLKKKFSECTLPLLYQKTQNAIVTYDTTPHQQTNKKKGVTQLDEWHK